MKILLLNICLLFSSVLWAQTRDINFYIEQAKTNSPLIYESTNNNKTILLDRQLIKSILTKPQINIEANILFSPIISHDNNRNQFQWISEGANSYSGYDLSYSDGGQYQAIVSLKKSLLNTSVYKEYSQSANIATQINDNNIVLSKHEIEMLVSRQYIICLKNMYQSEISKSLFEDMQKQLKTMRELVLSAIYKQSDLMLLQIERDNYEIEYQKYLTEYKNSIFDLNLICGINDTGTVLLEDVKFELKSDDIDKSQFIKKFELDSLNILSKQVLFDQKYKPQLNVFTNAGLNAVYIPTFNRVGIATGINFTWNIFDGNQKKIQHDKSIIELETLEFDKQSFIIEHQVNKKKYLAQINSINTQIKTVANQLTQYEKIMELYEYQLSQAQISIMDFKNLIRDISAKKQEELILRMQKQAIINNYNYWNF